MEIPVRIGGAARRRAAQHRVLRWRQRAGRRHHGGLGSKQTTLYRLVQQPAATFFAEAEVAAAADPPQLVKAEFNTADERNVMIFQEPGRSGPRSRTMSACTTFSAKPCKYALFSHC